MRASGTPTRDLAWGVVLTPLHKALIQGRTLDARRLIAQGQRPDRQTVQLAFKQDRLATHALLRETGLETSLLPGSGLGQALESMQAFAQADLLGRQLLGNDEGPEPGARRTRL